MAQIVNILHGLSVTSNQLFPTLINIPVSGIASSPLPNYQLDEYLHYDASNITYNLKSNVGPEIFTPFYDFDGTTTKLKLLSPYLRSKKQIWFGVDW